MINEALVRSFLALARTGNMTEVGRQLYLSQQAVSKHLARLEEELDCVLFRRERGSMTLTEQGELYFEAFSRMEETFEQARERAGRLKRGDDNCLVISHLDMLDVHRMFKPIYRDFTAAQPDVRLVYKGTSQFATADQLIGGSVDVVFTFLEDLPDLEELDYLVIARLQELLVVSADHPLATDGAAIRDFDGELVFYTPEPDGKPGKEERLMRLGIQPERLVETDGILSSCSAVEMQQGVTFMTEFCRLLDGGSFRTYPTGEPATLVMAYLRRSTKPSLHRFVAFVAERVKETL